MLEEPGKQGTSEVQNICRFNLTWHRVTASTSFMLNIFVLLFADTTPQMVGFRTPLSSSQAKMNSSDTNTTIILPNYYFGRYGLLRALKSNTTRAGYIKLQVGFAY